MRCRGDFSFMLMRSDVIGAITMQAWIVDGGWT